MTQRNRSPRKTASSLFSLRPAGQPMSHEMLLCNASTVYLPRRSLISSATQLELSMMYDPRAIPMITSLATSHKLL